MISIELKTSWFKKLVDMCSGIFVYSQNWFCDCEQMKWFQKVIKNLILDHYLNVIELKELVLYNYGVGSC